MSDDRWSTTQEPPPSPGPDPAWSNPPPEGAFDRFRRIDMRRSSDGWLGGVCSGLAHRVGLDPLVIRAATVLLVIFFGLGLLIYLLAWLFIPDQTERTHVEEGLRHGNASSIVLLVITSLVLLGSLPWWAGSAFGFDGGFGLGGLLVTLLLAWGLWSVWQKRSAPGAVSRGMPAASAPQAGAPPAGRSTAGQGPSGTPPPPPPVAAEPDSPESGGASAARPSSEGAAAVSGFGPGSPPPPPPGAAGPPPRPPAVPPAPRRPRRRSGGLASVAVALGLLMVVLAGSLWVSQVFDLPGNDLSVALATCAAVLGLLVLALGAAGRRAGFVGFLTGVSVLVAVVAAPLPADLQWEGRGGQATWAPRTADDLRNYRLAAGEAELDLRRLDTDGLNGQTVEVSLGAGSLTVLVPQDLTVAVESNVGVGELRLDETPGSSQGGVPRFSDGRTNDTTSGLGIQEQVELGEDRSPQLVIDANVGVGETVIEQE
jgi:phage shock protein PspC (stress-responsive transcriptional regulator)